VKRHLDKVIVIDGDYFECMVTGVVVVIVAEVAEAEGLAEEEV